MKKTKLLALTFALMCAVAFGQAHDEKGASLQFEWDAPLDWGTSSSASRFSRSIRILRSWVSTTQESPRTPSDSAPRMSMCIFLLPVSPQMWATSFSAAVLSSLTLQRRVGSTMRAINRMPSR